MNSIDSVNNKEVYSGVKNLNVNQSNSDKINATNKIVKTNTKKGILNKLKNQ